MEKSASLARPGHEWLWQGDNTPPEAATLAETVFFPCGVYSRIEQRLNAAIGDRDPINIPSDDFTPDCLQFAVCLPFYGYFLSKLQNTVRTFYDIDGNDISDGLSGCVCPYVTLVRNESEIILRERLREQPEKTEDGSSSDDPYEPQPPMDTPDPWSCGDPEASDTLKSIPEGSRETSTASIPSRCVSQSESGANFEGDVLVCADASGPKTHQLDRDIQLPVELDDAHSLNDDPETVANLLLVRDTSHDISLDPTIGDGRPPKSHSIELDPVAPAVPPRQPPPHVIHKDQIVSSPQPVVLHSLHRDIVASPGRDGPSSHRLEEDQLSPARHHGHRNPHTLEEDQPIRSVIFGPRPHQLRDDK
ncbi:hypothetical protein BGZ63DRAFT_424612 [Mariannaea sp. PMI_226]|nr:hypothetical protein BGZ63DRAFT_424612 [Mariannaea sp. PMI_226]